MAMLTHQSHRTLVAHRSGGSAIPKDRVGLGISPASSELSAARSATARSFAISIRRASLLARSSPVSLFAGSFPFRLLGFSGGGHFGPRVFAVDRRGLRRSVIVGSDRTASVAV